MAGRSSAARHPSGTVALGFGMRYGDRHRWIAPAREARKDPLTLPQQPALQELHDDLRLTQFGERGAGAGFRDRLRPEIGETEVSLILGDVDADAASMLIVKYLSPWRVRRVTTVGLLRQAGFQVVHSPSRYNRLHVSVFAPTREPGGEAEWDDELAAQFNACFTKYEAGEVTAREHIADAGQSGLGTGAPHRER